ncbi:MAG: DUF5053 domain-containing protein [Bacteroidales bacterium]|nr:DUF5053 domain-containing protein [Bacteroidales bacterium]
MAKGNYFGLELHNMEGYIQERTECIRHKGGALSTQFDELDGLINISKFSKRFMHKSQSWFSQKLHGCTVCNIQQSFSADEYSKLAQSFRELARQLNQYADELDAAE